MYLANYTRPDIAFSVNLLARYGSAPTQRHWNGIKHILRCLQGITDICLFYSKESKQQLFGYAYKTQENSNFLKMGKMIISVKI